MLKDIMYKLFLALRSSTLLWTFYAFSSDGIMKGLLYYMIPLTIFVIDCCIIFKLTKLPECYKWITFGYLVGMILFFEYKFLETLMDYFYHYILFHYFYDYILFLDQVMSDYHHLTYIPSFGIIDYYILGKEPYKIIMLCCKSDLMDEVPCPYNSVETCHMYFDDQCDIVYPCRWII